MRPIEVKISIITINYNNAKGLENTIISVLNQKYENIEYLVIDGGSLDSSDTIIAKYRSQLDYWVIEADRGIYNAMNKGIEKSTGDYLLFINSGDCLINNNVLQQAIDSGITQDLVYGNMQFIKFDVKREWILPDELSFLTFYSSTLPHPCTFIKRQLFDMIGLYNENLIIASDWEFFMLAVCKYNCSYKHIDLFITVFDEEGISSDPKNLDRINNERLTVLTKHFPRFLKDYEDLMLLKGELRKARRFLKIRKAIKSLFSSN